MAYVLGFFAADGYMTHNRRGANFWCLQINDKELLETIKHVVGAEHKISIRDRTKNNPTYELSYRLQIGSKEMCDDLRKLGMCERKTKSLAVPNVPTEFFADFVRGYFDGDGCVWVGYTHKKRIKPTWSIMSVFTSCSNKFLSSLQQRLFDFDIGPGQLQKCKGSFSRLVFSFNDSLKLYDFMYNSNTLHSEGLFLERKKCIFERYIQTKELVKNKCGRSSTG